MNDGGVETDTGAVPGACRGTASMARTGEWRGTRMKTRLCRLLSGLILAIVPPAYAGTAVGDWGHFVMNQPQVLLNNPSGLAFTVTIHVMRWPVAEWNPPGFKARLTGPDGKVIAEGSHALERAECVLQAPAGTGGVYRLDTEGPPHWISSSLDESVLWTGDPRKDHVFRERFAPVFQCVVPRRWWFFVPAEVTRFAVKAQRSSEHMSQREDWGMFVISPRGQRMRALWGQPPNTQPYRQDMTAEVEVEPGTGGRFWAVEIAYGDSHPYSKPNICLDGVPPYLARSPEEWFDPATGRKPAFKVYDEDPFIQSARDEAMMKARWPDLQHFSPCPSLGDPDGAEVLGDASFALWNPEGRPLRFRIGTYLPRHGADAASKAQVTVTGPQGATVFENALPILHIHGSDGQPTDTLETGRGVSRVRITGADRWFAFTYPATPIVLAGSDAGGGWSRFRLSAATARHWFFMVPRGTTAFSVRAVASQPDDVMSLSISAPDRTMAVIYDRAGEKTVTVPEGLDGKRWHLRVDTASAGRMITRDEPYRYQDMELTIDLRGVPGFLSPTWEQWFDPGQAAPGNPGDTGAPIQQETGIIPSGLRTTDDLRRPLPVKVSRVYKQVDGRDLVLDVYPAAPTPSSNALPAIVFVHGGGWHSGSTDHFAPHCRYFSSRGMVAVNVSYRLTRSYFQDQPGVGIVDCIADVQDAIRWIRANAGNLGVNPARIAVAGDSAGGHLAAAAAILPDPRTGLPDSTAIPDAMLLCNPVLDLSSLPWCRGIPGIEKGAETEKTALARQVSPLLHIRPGLPPALILHGADDNVVPVEQARRFQKLMSDAGNRCESIIYGNTSHAFVLLDLTANPAPALRAITDMDRFLAGLGYLDGPPTLGIAPDLSPDP